MTGIDIKLLFEKEISDEARALPGESNESFVERSGAQAAVSTVKIWTNRRKCYSTANHVNTQPNEFV